MWSMLGSAGTFGLAALELPQIDPKVLVITSDLRNFSGLDRFAATHPDRFINVGIAEQNMVSVAAGLVHEGFSVFATTYATFAAARSADQVRVNMGYMNLGVKLVGMAAGLSAGLLGATHMSLEDLAVMRAIPNMTVISPADCTETVKATLALASHDGPAYLRLGGGVPHKVVFDSDYEFEIGKGVHLRRGSDVTFVGSGSVVASCVEAASILEAEGWSAGVVDMHTVKPIDTHLLETVADESKMVVTVEEHNVIAGLGSAVTEQLAGVGNPPLIVRLGVADFFPHAASYDHLVRLTGLSADGIVNSVGPKLEALRLMS